MRRILPFFLHACLGTLSAAINADPEPPAPSQQAPEVSAPAHQAGGDWSRHWRIETDSSVSALARAADAVEAHADRLQEIELEPRTQGDATRTSRAYFDGTDLLLVVDEIHQGDYGASERRYFFDGEWLYHHRAAGRQLAADNSGLVRLEMRIYLSADGTAMYAFKSLGEQATTITDKEIAHILIEAQRLRQRFR